METPLSLGAASWPNARGEKREASKQSQRMSDTVSRAKGVLEVVGMFPLGNHDRQLACKARQLTGAGIGNYGYGQLRRAAIHGSAVLENKRPGAAMQRAADQLHGYI